MHPPRNERLKLARNMIIDAYYIIQETNRIYHNNDENYTVNILSHICEQLDDIQYDLIDKAGCLGD